MKKLGLLVIPTMAVSFLMSCGGGQSEPAPWYIDTTYLNSLTRTDVTKEGGEIKTIKVNGLDHKVRLIGVDEDCTDITKPDETKIHTTWEFVDLLSDSNGFSLAAYWDDTAAASESNYNYKNSTTRACLNGTFTDPKQGSTKQINWFQYFGSEEDTESTGKNRHFSENYMGKSVLSMLPTGLADVLKAPSKYININNGSAWEEQTIKDKLFLLSPKEMGNTTKTEHEERDTTVYSYYDGANNSLRIKHQINWHEGARTEYLSGEDLDGERAYSKNSFAGYNSEDTDNGCRYFFRSPSTNTGYYTWRVGDDGEITTSNPNVSAFAVAPAFCI